MITVSSKRPAFRDPLLQAEFNTKGYVVVDVADPREVQQLLDAFRQLYPYEQEGSVFSSDDPDFDRRLHAQALLRNVIEGKASTLLDRYQFVSGAFVAKHPGEKSVIDPHTDLTYIDHQHYSAVAVLTPLTDVTSDSGRLHVLPGSHLYTPVCGSNLYRTYPQVSLSQMIELEPKLGQAVCYDLQLIHASPANQSAKSRIAANCFFTPIEAQLLHFVLRDDSIYRYGVDLEFYSSRRGDEAPKQDVLQRYSVLDTQPSDLVHDRAEGSGIQAKRHNVIQRLINRFTRFNDR